MHVVLIHGLGDGRFVWDAFESMLGEHAGGVSFDLRGHGDSPWDPLRRYDAESLASDVVSLIDALDWPAMVLIGHSLGGELAARAAGARASRVKAVVVVDGGPELERAAALRIRQDLRALPRQYSAIAELEDILSAKYPLAERATLGHYARSALRPHATRGFELKMDSAIVEGILAPDIAASWSALESLACPLLLVRGRMSSVLTRERALDVARRIPACRVVEVPNAGHAIPLENPRGLHEAVAPFLDGLVTLSER